MQLATRVYTALRLHRAHATRTPSHCEWPPHLVGLLGFNEGLVATSICGGETLHARRNAGCVSPKEVHKGLAALCDKCLMYLSR